MRLCECQHSHKSVGAGESKEVFVGDCGRFARIGTGRRSLSCLSREILLVDAIS